MNIQIFGVKKCFDTQKAERYFKERKIKYQLVDIVKYPLSKGEFESVKTAVGIENMINSDSKDYLTLNMNKINTPANRADIVFNHPKLYKTPIVRNGRKATVGYQPDVWKSWEE